MWLQPIKGNLMPLGRPAPRSLSESWPDYSPICLAPNPGWHEHNALHCPGTRPPRPRGLGLILPPPGDPAPKRCLRGNQKPKRAQWVASCVPGPRLPACHFTKPSQLPCMEGLTLCPFSRWRNRALESQIVPQVDADGSDRAQVRLNQDPFPRGSLGILDPQLEASGGITSRQ